MRSSARAAGVASDPPSDAWSVVGNPLARTLEPCGIILYTLHCHTTLTQLTITKHSTATLLNLLFSVFILYHCLSKGRALCGG